MELKKKLAAQQKESSEAHVQLQVQMSTASRQLQEQCRNLEFELEMTQGRVQQLEKRQKEFVNLQSGVLELWTLMTGSPEFKELGDTLQTQTPIEMLRLLKVSPTLPIRA